jgi:hypothetical protein
MYIKPNPVYYKGSQQVRLRAPFLLLLQLREDKALRPQIHAIIRRVALQQFGHFMMGSANILGEWHVVSGAYGNDGLPMVVDRIPKDATSLPDDLAEAYWAGDGWNGAGSEAPALRQWALGIFQRENT